MEKRTVGADAALAMFLASRGGRVRARTGQLYKERLEPFVAHFGRNRPIAELSRADVLAWLAVLESRSYAPATLAGYRGDLKTFIRYCLDKNWIVLSAPDESPIYRIRTGSKRSAVIRIPSPDEVEAVRRVALRWMLHETDRRKIRDGLVVAMSMRCGPRSGEIRNITLREVDRCLRHGANRHGVYLLRSGGKTEQTVIRLLDDEVAGVRRWLDVRPKKATVAQLITPMRRSRVKGDAAYRWRQMSRSGLEQCYESVCKAAGVRVIYSHEWRHWVGTDMARRGFSAPQIGHTLNHADADDGAATAYRYYIATDEDDVSAAVAGRGSAESDDAAFASGFADLFGVKGD